MIRRLLVAVGIGLLLIALISCASSPATTSATVQASTILLPAPADSSGDALWGFIDGSGRWVIEPRFQGTYRFVDGLARVELGGKWGYIDQSGKLVVPATYTEAHDFSEGLARVATKLTQDPSETLKIFPTASDYGFIDKTGTVVIPTTWKDAGDFSEGLAPVMAEDTPGESGTSGDDLCGYIDTKGRLVIPLSYRLATRFSEGLAAVCGEDGWGYIDKSGAWAIKPIPGVPPSGNGVPDSDFALDVRARSFQNGLAAVGVEATSVNPDLSKTTWHFIDKTGKQTGWSSNFAEAGSFSEGLAPIKDFSGAWGFIDTSGKLAIPAQFSRGYIAEAFHLTPSNGFHQGLAPAADDFGNVGYIDKTGTWVIQPQFFSGEGFRDGYAYVLTTDSRPTMTPGAEPASPEVVHWEIIDLTGRVIYKPPEPPGNGPPSSS